LVDNASARDAITALFDRERPPTAIFAANNLTCIRVLQALHRSRLMSKVTVVGFDDIEVANLLHPPVSVVRQDPAAIGQLAAQIIFAELAGQRSTAREVFVPVTLVPRGELRTPAPDSAPRVHRT
jgi:LacI family transcriptional regulator